MGHIPVFCTATFPDRRRCLSEWNAHVHQPRPCPNGYDERHHEFAPPKTVAVEVLGRTRRVRVTA